MDYEQQLLMDAFKKFDKDGNGRVSAAEMKFLLCKAGKNPMDEADVDSWFNEFDVNGDGDLNYEGNILCVNHVSSSFYLKKKQDYVTPMEGCLLFIYSFT